MENTFENETDSAAIDVRQYKLLDHGEVSTKDLYSHPLARVIDPKDHSIWFRKLMEHYQTTVHAVLACHLIRLYDPLQPKTILAWHPRGTSYVLSQEVPNFRNLPSHQGERFENNEYPGLGRALILSIIFYNTDLKNGNIGLGEEAGEGQEVVKIVDGDWFFAPFRDPEWYADKPNTISSELLDQLPFPHTFYAYHWLDYVQSENVKNESDIVSSRLSNAEGFRLEINQIILKCLLTPRAYLSVLVRTLLPASLNANQYIEFIQQRFSQLKQSACENRSFQTYVKTTDAQITARTFAAYLEQYSIQNGYNLFTHQNAFIFKTQFSNLKKEWFPHNSPMVSPVSKFRSRSSASLTLSIDSTKSSGVFSNLEESDIEKESPEASEAKNILETNSCFSFV